MAQNYAWTAGASNGSSQYSRPQRETNLAGATSTRNTQAANDAWAAIVSPTSSASRAGGMQQPMFTLPTSSSDPDPNRDRNVWSTDPASTGGGALAGAVPGWNSALLPDGFQSDVNWLQTDKNERAMAAWNQFVMPSVDQAYNMWSDQRNYASNEQFRTRELNQQDFRDATSAGLGWAQFGLDEQAQQQANEQFLRQIELERQLGMGRLDVDRGYTQGMLSNQRMEANQNYALGNADIAMRQYIADQENRLANSQLAWEQAMGRANIDLARQELGYQGQMTEAEIADMRARQQLAKRQLGLETELGRGRLSLDQYMGYESAALARQRFMQEGLQFNRSLEEQRRAAIAREENDRRAAAWAAFGRAQAPNVRFMRG